MKYLLPEAIHIDKVLVHDKKTLCMKPDLKVFLDFGPVEGHSSESAYVALRKLFGSRLTDFLSNHPEVFLQFYAVVLDCYFVICLYLKLMLRLS